MSGVNWIGGFATIRLAGWESSCSRVQGEALVEGEDPKGSVVCPGIFDMPPGGRACKVVKGGRSRRQAAAGAPLRPKGAADL